MSSSMRIEMNANVFKGISDVIMASIMASLVEAGKEHGFNGEAEFKRQGFELVVKTPKKKDEDANEKEKKEKLILPFEKAHVNYDLCQGIIYNKGLFTQCEKRHLENGKYCKSCQMDASKNDTCEPLCGNVDRRLSCGLYDYKDNKGRSPKNYGEFIENLGLNVTDIEVRALHELNYKISPEHLAKPEKKESTRRGRPKKESVPIECKEVSDIFLELTKEAEPKAVEEEVTKAVEEEVTKAPELKRVQTDEMPEVTAKKEEAKAKAKKGKISDEEKQAKEAKKEAEKQAKEAKKEAEKQAKEAKKEAEKLQKEAEKKQKEAEKKQKEEAENKQKEEEKKDDEDEEDEEKEPAEKVKVCRIQINKKNYLIDKSTNILYDPVTKEEVGVWNEDTKTIEELPEEDDDQLDEESELEDDDYN